MFKGEIKRKLTLKLYMKLTEGNYLKNSLQIERIAKKYYDYYVYISKGFYSKWQKIRNDLLIIACASKYGMDIIISEDKRTMNIKKKKLIKCYEHINIKEGLRTPNFHTFNFLKNRYTKS